MINEQTMDEPEASMAKSEAPVEEEQPVEEEEEEKISVVPVPMKDAPLPLPDMTEEKIELVDSGVELEGLDVTGSFEHPAGL